MNVYKYIDRSSEIAIHASMWCPMCYQYFQPTRLKEVRV